MVTLPPRFTLSNPQIQTPIYHYCSPETFINIIESRSLWLTPINKLNDYYEGNWLTHLVCQICSKRQASRQVDKELFKIFVDNISSNINSRMPYIACFSEEPDLLSQWRGYADNGQGMSIAFTTHTLEYSLKDNFESALPGAGYWNGLCRVHYVDQSDEDVIIWINQVLDSLTLENYAYLAKEISGFALLFKNKAFEEEKEWRIVITPDRIIYRGNWALQDNNLKQKLNFRSTDKGLSTYFALPLGDDAIEKIYLGPTNKSEPNEIGAFVSHKLGRRRRVVRSQATYRG